MRAILLACCFSLTATPALAQTANTTGVRGQTVTAFEHSPTVSNVAISRAARNAMVVAQPPAPGTCKQGFVWREASASDRICAPPASRDRVAAENAAASENRESAFITLPLGPPIEFPDGGPCKTGLVDRAAFPGDNVCVTPAARDAAWHENTLAPGRTNL